MAILRTAALALLAVLLKPSLASATTAELGLDYSRTNMTSFFSTHKSVLDSVDYPQEDPEHSIEVRLGLGQEWGRFASIPWGGRGNIGTYYETREEGFGLGAEAGLYIAPGIDLGPSLRLSLLISPMLAFKGRLPKEESPDEKFGGSQYKMFMVKILNFLSNLQVTSRSG